LKNAIFWDVAPCITLGIYRRFGKTSALLYQKIALHHQKSIFLIVTEWECKISSHGYC